MPSSSPCRYVAQLSSRRKTLIRLRRHRGRRGPPLTLVSRPVLSSW
jgi:hypothetical protein